MLKSLIFDLGRVLIPFDFQRGYQGMARRAGLEPEEVRARIKALNLVTPYETGLIETREFIDAVTRQLNVRMPDADFGEIWGSIFLPETLLPDSFLEDLRSRYRLVLLSNTNELHYNLVAARYPLLRHFHARVLSYEVKAMKPDARIFEAAIAAAQCRAEECFFTDDIADYVEGAKRMGIDAVQFESEAQIRRELAARGCLPNGAGGETRGR